MDPTNPFLILRLSSGASSAEIKRAGSIAGASARLAGETSPSALNHLKAVEGAIEQLRDPMKRLRHSVGWPALGPVGAERLRSDIRFAAILADATVDSSEAVEDLIAGESPHVQAHARAVFALIRASSILQLRASGSPTAPDEPASHVETACRALSDGLQQWRAALSRREFWIEWRLRAKELDDPRITADFLQRMEQEAPSLPLACFGEIARGLLHVRDGATCKTLVQAMRRGSESSQQLDLILSEVYGPTCSRALATIEALQGELRLLTSKKAEPYRLLLERCEREILPDLQLILEVGDLPGYSEEMVRDKATELLRALAVQAANGAGAFDVSEYALDFAAKAANSPNLRAKVAEEQKIVEKLMAKSGGFGSLRAAWVRLHVALVTGQYDDAIIVIDELCPRESGERLVELRRLRVQAIGSLSETRRREGIMAARRGRYKEALSLLARSREREPRAAQLIATDIAIAAVQQVSRQGLAYALGRWLAAKLSGRRRKRPSAASRR